MHLILEGATTAVSYKYLYEGSELENKGSSAVLTLADGSQLIDGDGAGNSVVNDAGATIITASTATNTYIYPPLTNSGTLTATSGTLNINSLTNEDSGGKLTGGTYIANGGTLQLPTAVTTNAASIVEDGGSSDINLTSLSSNTGSLDLHQSLSVFGALANSGTLTQEGTGTLQATTYTQSAGTTSIGGGTTLDATSNTVAINGGQLTGTGAITGNLQGAGTIVPSGTVSGPLTVSGTYHPSSSGTLSIPISGTANPGTDYGQLSVGGAATLGGKLQLATASGYLPPVGTKYTILKAGSVSGTFSSVTGTQLADRQYLISYTATSVVATVAAADSDPDWDQPDGRSDRRWYDGDDHGHELRVGRDRELRLHGRDVGDGGVADADHGQGTGRERRDR